MLDTKLRKINLLTQLNTALVQFGKILNKLTRDL